MRPPGQLSTLLAGVLCAAVGFAPRAEAGITSVDIDGDEAVIDIDVGLLDAELTLTFENSSNLSESNLGLDAVAVNPLDTGLLARLPSLVSLATGLLLLIEVDPPSGGGLQFEDRVILDLDTPELSYSSNTPFRLFAAHGSGDFEDITTWVGSGSYRVRGSAGDFSQFLVLVEARSVDTVIEEKFDRLWDLLDTYSGDVDSGVLSDLENLLTDAEESYGEDSLSNALGHLDDFIEEVETHRGEDVPDVWRSARDLDNVAGLLHAAAETLQFSITWKAEH